MGRLFSEVLFQSILIYRNMKTNVLFVLAVFAIAVFTLSGFSKKLNQEATVITAVFDGHEDYGYNFIVSNNNEDAYTMTFQGVNEDVLESFNLNDESFIGVTFKITYTTEVLVSVDDYGYEYEEELHTIIKLEKQ